MQLTVLLINLVLPDHFLTNGMKLTKCYHWAYLSNSCSYSKVKNPQGKTCIGHKQKEWWTQPQDGVNKKLLTVTLKPVFTHFHF